MKYIVLIYAIVLVAQAYVYKKRLDTVKKNFDTVYRNYRLDLQEKRRGYERDIHKFEREYIKLSNKLEAEKDKNKRYKHAAQANNKLLKKQYTALYNAYTTVFEREADAIKLELDQLTGRVLTFEQAQRRNQLKSVLDYIDERGSDDAKGKS